MHTLLYDRRIEKDLRPIPREFRRLILQHEGYRLRVGDYCVLFTIDDRAKYVTIYRIRHRREAYR